MPTNTMQTGVSLRALVGISFASAAKPDVVQSIKDSVKVYQGVQTWSEGHGNYDLVIEAIFPSFVAYHEWHASVQQQGTEAIVRMEVTFLCAPVLQEMVEGSIWVSQGTLHKSLPLAQILKVRAERDYMHVHTRDHTWLVHATMRTFAEALCPRGFVRLNRSILVRPDAVRSVRRVDKRWCVELYDGSEEFVARSAVKSVLNQLSIYPSKIKSTSLHLAEPEDQSEVSESKLRLVQR